MNKKDALEINLDYQIISYDLKVPCFQLFNVSLISAMHSHPSGTADQKQNTKWRGIERGQC